MTSGSHCRKRIIYILVAVLVVAVYLGTTALWLNRDDSAARGRFEIVPTDSDIGGVLAGSGFLICPAAGESLTVEDVRGELVVEPSLDYSLTQAANGAVLLKPRSLLTSGARLSFTYGDYQSVFTVRRELAVVSIEPHDRGGVALDEPVVITFNQAVTVSAGDSVVISPRVQGTWSAEGERLSFTPKRYENGTIYTVTVAGELITDGSLRTVEQAATASFETQDTADRLPAAETFDLDVRELVFAPDETWSIPFSYTDGGDVPELTAELWTTADGAQYCGAVQELLSLPTYAVLTRDNWRADIGAWQSLGKIEGMVSEDGDFYYQIPGQPAGYYILRLSCGAKSRQLAVTVSTLDGKTLFNGDSLLLWAHENGKPAAGGEGVLNGRSLTLDSAGCGVLNNTSIRDMKGWLYLHSGDSERYFYLGDTTADTASGSLYAAVADQTHIDFGGAVIGLDGTAVPRVEIVLCSSVGELCRTAVEVNEYGVFSGDLSCEPLMNGNYSLQLQCLGQLVAATTVTWGEPERQAVSLTAEPSLSTAAAGEEIVFRVTARDGDGQPVPGLTISSSVDEAVRHVTDENGATTFYQRFYLPEGMDFLRFTATFASELDDGSTVSANAYVRVGQNQASLQAPSADSADDGTLAILRGDGGLMGSSDEEAGNGDLQIRYDSASRTYSTVPAAEVAAVSGQTNQTVKTGEAAEYILTLSAPSLVVASLYAGAGGDTAPVLQRVLGVGEDSVCLTLPTLVSPGEYTVDIQCVNAAGVTSVEAGLTVTGETAVQEAAPSQTGDGTLLYEVVEGVSEDAALVCLVSQEDQENLSRLLEINLLPGDQLLQGMGRHSFASAYFDLPACGGSDNNITSLQNSDGSFSRLVGGRGDLLLCALVARDNTLVYNRSALLAYARIRLENSDDTTARALAYWVLASLDDDILQPLKNLVGNKELKLRDQLYLAEALLAAGDRATAERIYMELTGALHSEDGSQWLASESEQATCLCTLLMTDLSIRLGRGDEDALLAYLLDNEMESMTNRYLLSECLLAVTGPVRRGGEDVEEMSDDEIALSAVPALSVELSSNVSTTLLVGGEEAETAAVDELTTLELGWPGNNSATTLYLVAFRVTDQANVCETDTVHLHNGCATAIVDSTELPVLFRGRSEGPLCGDIYILNLTMGRIIGLVTENALQVTE